MELNRKFIVKDKLGGVRDKTDKVYQKALKIVSIP